MKPSLVLAIGLALVAPTVIGCASEEAEGRGADYPEPVGYDSPGQLVASSSAQTQQPIPSTHYPSTDVPGITSEEDVQPQAGDVQVGADADSYTDTDPSALTDFRPALDPYGTWVEDPTYGTIWQPSPTVVGEGFTPYVTAGHWAYDDDYVWVSDYDWGWAPFHYGRWVYASNRWGWIPGRTYAGAWVSWRYGYEGYGYLGWAPMPPSWYWRGGYAYGIGVVPFAPYYFCGYHDVFDHNVAGRVIAGPQVAGIAAHTRPYVPAHPSVGGGRTPAHPGVGGPPPAALGIPQNQIAHAPPTDRGLMHAQQFAHPQTAQPLGAHAPAAMAATHAATTLPYGQRYAQSSRPLGSIPSYGRSTAIANAPRYQGVAPTPYHAPSTSFGPTRSYEYARPNGGAYGNSYGASRAYGGGGAYGGGSYGGGTHYSPPAYSQHYGSGYTPSYGGGGAGMFHGGGASGFHPSNGSNGSNGSSSSQQAPGPAGPGPSYSRGGSSGFRGGGGGAFHGGGSSGFRGGGGRR